MSALWPQARLPNSAYRVSPNRGCLSLRQSLVIGCHRSEDLTTKVTSLTLGRLTDLSNSQQLQVPSAQAHRSSLFPHTFCQVAAQPQKNRPSAARKPRFVSSMRVMGQVEAEIAERQQSEDKKGKNQLCMGSSQPALVGSSSNSLTVTSVGGEKQISQNIHIWLIWHIGFCR